MDSIKTHSFLLIFSLKDGQQHEQQEQQQEQQRG